jgi:hypothetical protein
MAKLLVTTMALLAAANGLATKTKLLARPAAICLFTLAVVLWVLELFKPAPNTLTLVAVIELTLFAVKSALTVTNLPLFVAKFTVLTSAELDCFLTPGLAVNVVTAVMSAMPLNLFAVAVNTVAIEPKLLEARAVRLAVVLALATAVNAAVTIFNLVA